jgi:hypothetical protein
LRCRCKVETNSATGWKAFNHTVPTHPQRLATGETKDVVIGVPTDLRSWRLRVTYGKDVKGFLLLVGKTAYAISDGVKSHRFRWPGPGFGVMGGSNSCISLEISE